MFKNKRNKILATSFLLSGISVMSLVASSCSSAVEKQVLDGLFKTESNPRNFSNSSVGSFNEVLQNSLENDQGFNNFARYLLADSLENWYENNASSEIVEKYRNWEKEADTKLESETTSLRNQFRRNFEVRRQTDVLDINGGTVDAYKRKQVLTNVFTDFSSLVFQNDYLGYFNDDNKPVANPLIDEVSKPENWKHIKFYAEGYTDNKSEQNNKQMFADFQSYVFDQWVRKENPNLVSRLVFTNEDIRGGLDQIFNKKILGDDLRATYNFQAFTDPNKVVDKTSPKLSTGFKQLVANDGLNNYYNPENYTVDFLNQFSSDSGGKLLMTASGMFNSFDVAFSTAYVQQYQDLVNNVDKDNAVASVTLDPDNIMKNFIFADQADANSKYSTKLDLTSNDNQLKEISEKIKSSILVDKIDQNSYYSVYKDYAEGKSSIHEYIRPKSTNEDANKIAKQFILSRGKDGIHIIAIDGANYYLTGNTRDIEKQKQFLLFRNELLKNSEFPKYFSEKTYQFNLLESVKKYFDDNNITLIMQFLLNAVNNDKSFLYKKGNEKFLDSLKKVSTILSDLAKNKAQYNYAKKVRNDALNVRDKILERAKMFDDLVKSNKSPSIGLAAKLPHPAASDGTYLGIESYYKELLVENNLLDKASLATKDTGLTQLFNKVVNDAKDNYDKSIKAAIDTLLLTGVSSQLYSQNVFVTSRYDSGYDVGINAAINATIALPTSANNFRKQFYLNDEDFKKFYDASKHEFKDYENIEAKQIKDVVDFYFIQSTWETKTDKLKYGSWTTQDEYKKVLENYFNSLTTITDPNDNASINYLRYINTFRYLIKDNLAEFKKILSNQITRGISANVSWTLTSGTKLEENGNIAATQDKVDFNKFIANPDYLQGSKFDFININKTVDSDPNVKAKNTNYSTVGNETTDKRIYGFNGLSVANSTANLNDEVKSVLFDNFEQSGLDGILYSFGGSLDEVIKYVNSLTSNRELDTFVELLKRAKVNINLFETDANGKPIEFSQRKTTLINTLSDKNILGNNVYTKFVGYIGENKKTSTDLTTQPEGFKPYRAAKSLTNWTTYVKQINFNDVSKLGGKSWLTSADNRLGLSVNELLSVIAKYAFDSSYQNNAELAIINSQQLISVNDKRLYDALGLRWTLKN
ncbi:DUF3713 domain-containing protein [Mycoplasma bradburyae]|nr:DUF3713 domain-containing protein [Mycoplasma bradburyae]